MDKYEYRVKTEQMLEHMEKRQYKKAMEIADTIDWRRVKNASMLNTVSEIYEFNGEFQKSSNILDLAYDRSPGSRKIVYRLGTLALKLGDAEMASECYEEFIKLAPKDPNQFILKYKILKARRAPVQEQIDALEEFKKSEYVEKWAYELAKLYHEAGMTAECLEECDDLILWFSEGKYVYQAMELKMKYKPLTPLQQEKYADRNGGSKKATASLADVLEEDVSEEEESVSDLPDESDEDMEERPESEDSRSEAMEELYAESDDDKDIELEKTREIPSIGEAIASMKKAQNAPIRKTVKGATLAEALVNGVAVASGIDIEEKASTKRDEEMRITGQMKIEEILQEWEAKQKSNAEAIEMQKQKDEEALSKKKEEAEKRRAEEARRIEEQQRAAEEAQRIQRQKAAQEARRLAEKEAEERRLLEAQAAERAQRFAKEKEEEEELLLERLAAGRMAEIPEEEEEAEPDDSYEEEEALYQDTEKEEETGEDIDAAAEETDEEFVEEIDDEYEEDTEEASVQEKQGKSQRKSSGMTADLKQLMEELEQNEAAQVDAADASFDADLAAFDDEEYEDEPEDFDDLDYDDYDDIEEEDEESSEISEDEFFDDDLEFDLEDEKEPEEKEEQEELEIEEPTEEEIQRRIKKGKSGVPFDTGFVVTGRYDLSATSEIGLKAGLTEDQKKLFSYFVPVRGMSEQIVEVLDNDRREQRKGTSRTGNILVIGQKGSGKTVLAVDIVKAIQKQRNLRQGKVAIVTGESLNKKELSNIIQKLRGGAIIIEKAGKLNTRTVNELDYLMEKRTDELLVVLEDQRVPLEKLFTANPKFKKKFTSTLELPVFINDELVTFGQTYAKENGYKLDEMGILALYSRIDVLQREDHAVSVAEVKEIMDEAIDHSQKANVKHLARRVFRKGTDDSDRIILKEEDFRI